MYSSFVQCQKYSCCNSNIYYLDNVYGSHFCLPVKNQRHDKAGINDCKNLGMVKFLQVIDPYRIMSLVFKSKTEMCYFVFSILKLLQQKWKEMRSSFFILKLYQREWNRVKIHFTIPKFLKVIDPYPIMSLVFDSKIEI